MIKAIILDWGGVIIDSPGSGIFKRMAKMFNVTKKRFSDIHLKYEPLFYKGKIEEMALWKKEAKDLGVDPPKDAVWQRFFHESQIEREYVWKIIRKLKKRYKLAILSNTEIPSLKNMGKRYKIFDEIVTSCAQGCVKPGRRIYMKCIDKLQVKPKEAIFIDDKLENVQAARKAGLIAVQYKNFTQFKKALKQHKIEF